MARRDAKFYLEPPARRPHEKWVGFAWCILIPSAILGLGFTWWWSATFRPAIPEGLRVAMIFLMVYLVGVGLIEIRSRKHPGEGFFSSEGRSLKGGAAILVVGLALIPIIVFGTTGP